MRNPCKVSLRENGGKPKQYISLLSVVQNIQGQEVQRGLIFYFPFLLRFVSTGAQGMGGNSLWTCVSGQQLLHAPLYYSVIKQADFMACNTESPLSEDGK